MFHDSLREWTRLSRVPLLSPPKGVPAGLAIPAWRRNFWKLTVKSIARTGFPSLLVKNGLTSSRKEKESAYSRKLRHKWGGEIGMVLPVAGGGR